MFVYLSLCHIVVVTFFFLFILTNSCKVFAQLLLSQEGKVDLDIFQPINSTILNGLSESTLLFSHETTPHFTKMPNIWQESTNYTLPSYYFLLLLEAATNISQLPQIIADNKMEEEVALCRRVIQTSLAEQVGVFFLFVLLPAQSQCHIWPYHSFQF